MDPGENQPVIAGKYRLLRQLGPGATGSVWEARHLTLGSSVAVKLMNPALAVSPTGISRFLREARAAAGLRSPHVVQILDQGVDAGTPYIVTELLKGESLAARLERVGKLSPRATARIVAHIAQALSRAHRAGVMHRDLKPDNVFLVQIEGEELAKVLDFGIAKAHEAGLEQPFSAENAAAGASPSALYYVSPERAEGLETLDQRTDLWSLGVITFECLLGRRPFEGSRLPALFAAICTDPLPQPSSLGQVPHGFDAWFRKACARDLQQRFAWAKDAADELAKICSVEQPVRPTEPRAPATTSGGLAPRLHVPGLDDDEEDEAPTEIWREDLMDRLAYGGEPSETAEPRAITAAEPQAITAVELRAVTAPLPHVVSVPAPRAAPPAVRPVLSANPPATHSKGSARAAEERPQPPPRRRWLALGLVASLLAAAALGWALLSWRRKTLTSAVSTPAAVSSLPLAATAADTARAVASAAPLATSSVSADPSVEHVPTIDLSSLPMAPKAAPAPARPGTRTATRAQPPAARPRPAETPDDATDPSETLRNPYR